MITAALPRNRFNCSGLHRTALCSSRSTSWHPAAAALLNTSSSEAAEPRNLPPAITLRHVAIAMTCGRYSMNRLILGRRTPHVTVRKKAISLQYLRQRAGLARPRSGANMKKVGALLVIWLAVAAAAQQADSNPPEQQAPQGTLLNNAGFPIERIQT